MATSSPQHTLFPVPATWLNQSPTEWPWQDLEPLSPLLLNDGRKEAMQQTSVRLCFSDNALYVRFDCVDDDIWGNYTERDDPIYDEEVVEVFIAPGSETPTTYFEFEVSPKGVLFDCKVFNPSGFYDDRIEIDVTWNAAAISWHTSVNDQSWWAMLAIPWQAIGGFQQVWRANFYRIERSRKSGTELSAWSPTLRENMFHVPSRFGTLVCQESSEQSS